MVKARFILALVLAAAAGPGVVRADEWYDSYRQGVRALAQGQPARAAVFLEQAIAQRPEPGRNVVTYGTNVEREYFPYLRLAEARLQLRDPVGARAALGQAEKWGREPAGERRQLAARVEDLTPRPPTPAPAAPPTLAPAVETTLPVAPPTTTAPTPAPASPALIARQPPATATSAPRVPPALTASAPALPGPHAGHPETAGTLDVVSQPPGASVYVDDELVGTTDPEWGRLVRSGLTPGRHRVRLALSGHQDVVEEIDLGSQGRIDFRRRLAETQATDRRPILYGTVALVLLGLTAWALRRPTSSAAPASGLAPTPRSAAATPGPARGTPPGLGSPGAHRDAEGREFFGEYQLLGQLGRGGMASVWKAERRGETCALKRPLHAFLEEPEFLERFLREAEIGRTLHHPNVIRILERGEVEGVPYFTMELLPGETLQALLDRSGALPARQAASIVVQIAEALDYAHSKGVVHRDLKPSNVMVLADGTAKVMDYGIARARRFEGLTVTGAFLGSPDYIAPEAIEGRETDARSDLYSLGVTFYEALTGRRPFAADTPFAVLRLHLTEAPKPPSSLRPDVPPELDLIVLRLLNKTPAERFAAAEELVQELRDFLNRAA